MPADYRDVRVKLPGRLMTSQEVLREVHAQTGVTCHAYPTGALVRQIDATPFGGEATVMDVLRKLSPLVHENGSFLLAARPEDSPKDIAARIPAAAGTLRLEAELSDARLKELSGRLASGEAADRRLAAYELGNTKSTRAIAPLMAALGDKDESVRFGVLRALDRLERDYPAHHPPGRVSIFALAKDLPTEGLVAALKSASDTSTNEWIWAAGLIGRAGRPESARPELEKGLTNGYARTRETARWALARLDEAAGKATACHNVPGPGTPYAGEEPAALVRALAGAAAPEVRADLLLRLGRAGGKPAWDVLLAELNSQEPVARRAAIRALSRCPDPRAVGALMKILVGPEPAEPETGKEKGTPASASSLTAEYRNLAAMSLGMIGSDAVVAELAVYLKDNQKPISAAALALSWTEHPASEAPLVAGIKVPDNDEHGQANCVLRAYAYTGLARLGTPAAVDAIMTKFNEYDNAARYAGHAAVRLAGRSPAAGAHLTEIVRKGRSWIAAHGLEESEDPRAVDALLEVLPAAEGERLHFGLQALGRSGDPRAVPTLLALLDHRQPWVRYEALRALRWRWYWPRPEVREALGKHPVFRAFVTPPPALAEQPENTWVCRLWPVDFDDERAVNTTYEAGMAFDESRGVAVKTNGHGQRCDVPQLGETWLYDPAANSWRESSSPVVPFGMCGTWNVAYYRAERKVVAMEAEGGHHGWQWERGRALRGSAPWVYDAARDRWTAMQPLHALGGPGLRGFGPLVWTDGPGRVFLHGGVWGGNTPKEVAGRSWLYDLHANTWTMLPESKESPGNRTGHGMCYLPGVDRVLLAPGDKETKTWLCDPRTGQWKDAGASGKPPKLGLPLVCDPVTGTALAFHAAADGTTIWQYDPAANSWAKLDSPVDLSPHQDSVDVCYDPKHNVFIMDGGHVNWNTDHIAVREVWTYRFRNRPKDAPVPETPRPPVRPEPPLPEDVVVSVLADRTVEVRWAKPPAADVVGCHVYAAAVEAGERMHHKEVFRKLGPVERLTDQPVTGSEFVDVRKLAKAAGLFNHEIRAYHVRAVNKAGVESGPSATVLTLASSVPRAAAVERPDGSTRVTWTLPPERDLRGYAVYRMDEFRTTLPVRLNPLPIRGTEFVDWPETPRAERRRYYVVAVDALGQEGIPSTGAWSFGRP
ncbi:MAG TPA: kelch repeat-containing protein [Planctomycetota bacterium]|nr:kelch repeat-containing protein [Planctomycetota bacterium]